MVLPLCEALLVAPNTTVKETKTNNFTLLESITPDRQVSVMV